MFSWEFTKINEWRYFGKGEIRKEVSYVEEKTYQFRQCFSENSKHRSHMITHTGENTYQCSYCDKALTFNISFVKHLTFLGSHLKCHLKIHTGEKPYQCSQCCKGFSMDSNLLKHYRGHTGEKPCQCSQCNKAFSQNSDL